jgi:AraC family transcriptional regulator
MPPTLDVVATQLIEAACCALGGDGTAAQEHIARALLLLQHKPGHAPSLLQSVAKESPHEVAGALSAWRAQRVAAYIESHLSGTIRVRDLAHLVGLSNSYFCHAFKRRYGLTVHVYLTCRRIEMAQRLMLATNESLSEIALSCGMSDQAHFTRAFRRIVGETPNRWRQSQRTARLESSVREVPGDLVAWAGSGSMEVPIDRSALEARLMGMIRDSAVRGGRDDLPDQARL